ncbi:MAG TPA: hypothetical protein VF929_02990 [Gemmatimonadaceae bacterium]
MATALGWTAGTPGAVVVLQRGGSTGTPIDSALTDGMGIARFSHLTAGTYGVRASRQLTADERLRAAAALRGIDALGGAATATVATGDNAVEVTLQGSGAGTLVFSEIDPTFLVLSSGSAYYYGAYIKIYNNSGDTVPLAGKLLANPISGWYATSQYGCELFAEFKGDPAGLWAQYVYRFPATARPIPPGGGAVIATDAIDHRTISAAAGFYDLSRAEYEFRGSADVVNPLAQGMISVGPRIVPDGHGWRPWDGRLVFALAEPLDLDTLPKKPEARFSGADYVRLPTVALLDVVQWKTTTPHFFTTTTDCPSSVVTDIDAGEAKLLTITDTLTMHRRVARILPNGRVVLQRTRNSAADFEAGPATPGKNP